MEDLRAIVLADGEPIAGPLGIPDTALVIAADGGLALAPVLGLDVDIVIGDMDSVAPEDLAAAEQAGVRIERYPADKDATDLELALDAALAAGATDITIVGGAGGRIDHLLANALLIADDRYAGAHLLWITGAERVVVCDAARPASLDGRVGDVISLIPVHGSVHGATSSGLRWPLEDEELPAASTRGISNEMTHTTATVSVSVGTLLVVQEAA